MLNNIIMHSKNFATKVEQNSALIRVYRQEIKLIDKKIKKEENTTGDRINILSNILSLQTKKAELSSIFLAQVDNIELELRQFLAEKKSINKELGSAILEKNWFMVTGLLADPAVRDTIVTLNRALHVQAVLDYKLVSYSGEPVGRISDSKIVSVDGTLCTTRIVCVLQLGHIWLFVTRNNSVYAFATIPDDEELLVIFADKMVVMPPSPDLVALQESKTCRLMPKVKVDQCIAMLDS